MRDQEMQGCRTRCWNGVMRVAALVLAAGTLCVVAPLPVLGQALHATGLAVSAHTVAGQGGDSASRYAVGDEFGDHTPDMQPRWQPATPPASPSSPRCSDDENLIHNGGFELGEEGWFVSGAVDVTMSEIRSGNVAIRLGSLEEAGYIDQRISSLVPGATY